MSGRGLRIGLFFGKPPFGCRFIELPFGRGNIKDRQWKRGNRGSGAHGNSRKIVATFKMRKGGEGQQSILDRMLCHSCFALSPGMSMCQNLGSLKAILRSLGHERVPPFEVLSLSAIGMD